MPKRSVRWRRYAGIVVASENVIGLKQTKIKTSDNLEVHAAAEDCAYAVLVGAPSGRRILTPSMV